MSDSTPSPDQLRGIFLYGVHLLQVNDAGLIPGVHDPDVLTTVGALCVVIDGLTEAAATPFDMTLSALAVLAGALLAADAANLPVPHLMSQWRTTLATADRLHLVGTTTHHKG